MQESPRASGSSSVIFCLAPFIAIYLQFSFFLLYIKILYIYFFFHLFFSFLVLFVFHFLPSFLSLSLSLCLPWLLNVWMWSRRWTTPTITTNSFESIPIPFEFIFQCWIIAVWNSRNRVEMPSRVHSGAPLFAQLCKQTPVLQCNKRQQSRSISLPDYPTRLICIQ